MADTLIAKGGTEAKFRPHPEGQYVAQCVDTIDLGNKVESFPGTPDKLAHKIVLVFRTGEVNEQTGEVIDIAREFTLSMNEKANLRKFLEQWRGKPYTAEQAEAGVPLHKLVGNFALITVAHRTSGAGRTYANLTACVGLPKQMSEAAKDMSKGYTRADYWQQRKDEYAQGVQAFRSVAAAPPADFDDFPAALEDSEDDLPF
jgi:hypothetical protein